MKLQGTAPAAAPAPAEPISEPADDAGFGDFGGDENSTSEPAPSDDKPFDDEPFDAGVEADEETDPKKFIEQLTGKLGQSLRKYNEEQGQPDFDLEKFVVNSVLSATHTSEMDEDDKKDIIKKVNTAGNDESNDDGNSSGDNDTDNGDDNGGDMGSDDNGGEEDLEETVYENFFLDKPKKNNMFQEGSNDILDEESDRCTRIAKRKYDVWPSAYASGAVVKCRQGKIWKGIHESDLNMLGDYKNMSDEQIDEEWSEKYKKSIDCNNPKGFSQKAHCDARKKRQRGEETKSKPVNENVSEISRIVNQYMKDTEYDIQNSLGNCSFFTRDVINWAKNNGVKADYVYMPMSEEYRKTNNISDNEWEDHIVPMINNVIIDFAYTPQGVSKNVRTSNTIPPKVFKYSDNLFKPNGIYGKFGYTKPEINTEYGNPKDINSFDVVEPNKKKEKLGELFIYESIDKIAGVWDTNEKFDDGSDFKIKFKVSDIIELAKDLPVKNIDPKKIEYDFSGRQEDPTKTKDRVNNADLSYPIIVVKNENGKIFAMLDGTHRLEKALKLGLDKIKTKILNKQDLIQFKTDSLNEAKKTDFSKEKESGLHGWFSRRGGEGSQGWVDCNTCRDGKCKPCGRKDGEERSKYPSCRPTPSACKSKGRGDSWGKKSANESDLSVYENHESGESNNYMFWLNLKGIHDDAIEILNMDKSAVDELIADGHQWALEHVITSKDDIEEVYHFLEGNLEHHNMMEGDMRESNNYMFWSSLKTIAHASGELLEMDKTMVDKIISDGHGWALDHIATSNDDMEEVYHFLANTLNAYDGDNEGGYEDDYGNVDGGELYEGKYDGKPLGKPMKGDVKKFKVYVRNKKGNVVKVNFGDPNMEIKRDDPKRRKSFRARHKCAQAKDRTTPKYWSCKMWSSTPVSKIVEESLINNEKNSIFDKNYLKMKIQETFNQDDVAEPMVEPQVAPNPKVAPAPDKVQPVVPSRKNKPFLPTPEVQPDPKARK